MSVCVCLSVNKGRAVFFASLFLCILRVADRLSCVGPEEGLTNSAACLNEGCMKGIWLRSLLGACLNRRQ